MLLADEAFRQGMRYPKLPLCRGGALDQPIILGQLVITARSEMQQLYILNDVARRRE